MYRNTNIISLLKKIRESVQEEVEDAPQTMKPQEDAEVETPDDMEDIEKEDLDKLDVSKKKDRKDAVKELPDKELEIKPQERKKVKNGQLYLCSECCKTFESKKPICTFCESEKVEQITEGKIPADKDAEQTKINKLTETVEELIGEVPGISVDDQKLLHWAIKSNTIPNEFPDDELIFDALSHLADVVGVEALKDVESVDRADIHGYYLKYVLLPRAKKAYVEKYRESKLKKQDASTSQPASFEGWKKEVDRILDKLCGMTSDDIDDWTYVDDFDAGLTPVESAKRAYRNAKKASGSESKSKVDEQEEIPGATISHHKMDDDELITKYKYYRRGASKSHSPEFYRAFAAMGEELDKRGLSVEESKLRESIFSTAHAVVVRMYRDHGKNLDYDDVLEYIGQLSSMDYSKLEASIKKADSGMLAQIMSGVRVKESKLREYLTALNEAIEIIHEMWNSTKINTKSDLLELIEEMKKEAMKVRESKLKEEVRQDFVDKCVKIFKAPNGTVQQKMAYMKQKGATDTEIIQALDTASGGEVVKSALGDSKLKEEEKDGYKTVAQGMTDRNAADKLAKETEGVVIQDEKDKTKFSVIVKEKE